jgi:hypothetical protein
VTGAMSDSVRWDKVDPSTALGQIVAPYVGMDHDDSGLSYHLLGDGTIQLSNPGFDEHLIGVGVIPWFGFGHCALLAWHLHLKSGWPLVTLGPGVRAPKVHTAVRRPDGAIIDWRGAQTEDESVDGYQTWLYPQPTSDPGRRSWTWTRNDPDEWVEQWCTFRPAAYLEMGGWNETITIGGREEKASPYDQFEITLTDYLADVILAGSRIEMTGEPHAVSHR